MADQDTTVLTGDDDTRPEGEGEQPGQGGSQDTTDGGKGPEGQGGKPGEGAGGGEAAAEGDGEGDGKGGKAGEGEGEPEAEGAPETYETFTVPDGVELRDEDVERFTGVARELDLSQDKAQKLVDLAVEHTNGLVSEQQQAWQDQVDQWGEETRTDQEIGGDHLDAATKTAQSVLRAFGTDELRDVLNKTGIGNHPELVRVFARIGKAMSEDQLVTGGHEGASEVTTAERLYPSQEGTAAAG